MEPHTNRSAYDSIHLSVGANGQTTFDTHSFATTVRKPVMVIRTRQPNTGAERPTHQDAREVTARPPSDCTFIVRFCQGNLWRQLTFPYPHNI
jgi:hypothetical protein